MELTNVAGYVPTGSFGDALGAAQLVAVRAQAALGQTLCAAVAHIKGLLDEANQLTGAKGARRKRLQLPRNYSMVLDIHACDGSYVLQRKGCRIASEQKTYAFQEEALEQFIMDLRSGLLEDVRTFIASAATRGKESHSVTDAPQTPYEVLQIQETLVPVRTGWDHDKAKRLDDGTLIIPRERKLLCPPAEENAAPHTSCWSDCWSPRDASELGEQVSDVRLALVHKGNDTWFAYLHGDTLLPQIVCEYEGYSEDDDNSEEPSVSGRIEWAMDEADGLEWDIEKAWAARWARSTAKEAFQKLRA